MYLSVQHSHFIQNGQGDILFYGGHIVLCPPVIYRIKAQVCDKIPHRFSMGFRQGRTKTVGGPGPHFCGGPRTTFLGGPFPIPIGLTNYNIK